MFDILSYRTSYGMRPETTIRNARRPVTGKVVEAVGQVAARLDTKDGYRPSSLVSAAEQEKWGASVLYYTRDPVEGGAASWPFGGDHPSVPALARDGGEILSTVCAATVVTVLNYPQGDSTSETILMPGATRKESRTGSFRSPAECAHVIFCINSF